MKRVFGIIALSFIAASFAYAQNNSTEQLIPVIKNAVVTVYAQNEEGEVFASGSGFFISSEGIAITNFHVLEGAAKGYVKDVNQVEYPIVSIMDYDPDMDIVKFKVIQGKKTNFAYLPLAKKEPQQGAPIISYSTPLGIFENTVSTGVVSSIREMKGYGRVLQITAPISHGSSGSPVIDNEGNVVGVSTFGFTGGQSLNFAVCSQQINKLTKSLNIPLVKMVRNKLETENVRNAIKAMKNENYGEAMLDLTLETRDNPDNHLAYYYMGLFSCNSYVFPLGFEYFNKAIELDPANSKYLNDLMVWLRNYAVLSNNKDGAVEDDTVLMAMEIAEKALNVDPYRGEPLANLAYIVEQSAFINNGKSINKDRMAIAESVATEAVETSPDPESFIIRGDIRTWMGKHGEALLDLDEAIRINPYLGRAYSQRAALKIYHLDILEDGIMDAERALALTHGERDIAELYALKGDAYGKMAFRLGRNAFDCFRKAVSAYADASKTFDRPEYKQYSQELVNKVIKYAEEHNGYFPNYQGSDITYFYLKGKEYTIISPNNQTSFLSSKPTSNSSSSAKNKRVVDKIVTSESAGEDVKIIRIELSDESTVVYISYTNTKYKSGGWYSISPEAFIRDVSTGKKYRLIDADNCSLSPQKTSIKQGETKVFALLFPPLPLDVSTVDFVESEDSPWKFYNIKL